MIKDDEIYPNICDKQMAEIEETILTARAARLAKEGAPPPLTDFARVKQVLLETSEKAALLGIEQKDPRMLHAAVDLFNCAR